MVERYATTTRRRMCPHINDRAAIDQARATEAYASRQSYVVLVPYLPRQREALVRGDAASQVRDVNEDATAMGGLVLALSGRAE